MYASCRNLLLEVRGVIKDQNGQILERKPIKKFSELFRLAMKHKDKLIPALLEKANAQDLCNRLSNSDRFNNPDLNKYKSDLERFEEIPDNHTGVDLEIRFHTIANYLGLICANDVDFFSETRDPFLVN